MTMAGRTVIGKAERQREIERVLRARPVSSQFELAKLLRERGITVTQATLSRDLDEIGAIKAGGEGYRLPDETRGWGDRLPRMLREFATGFESSGNLVVVHTPPGGAGPVARALDGAGLAGVIGTVAGDDTIIVVCGRGVRATRVAETLRALAHGGER